MLGLNIWVGAKIEASAPAARAQAVMHALVEAQAAAEVSSIAGFLMDQGHLEPDAGPPSCTGCGRELAGDYCPYCGSELGEQELPAAPDPDEEIWRAEESPGGDDEFGEVEEQALARDLPERLRDGFLDGGWDWETSESAGLWLCGLWESERRPSRDLPGFVECVRKFVIGGSEGEGDYARALLGDPGLIESLYAICCAVADEAKPTPQAATLTVIDIAWIAGRWEVVVHDPLKNLKRTDSDGWVNLRAGRRISVDKWLEVRTRHLELLQDLGKELLSGRSRFFEARDKVGADAELAGQALEQQKIAKQLKVWPSTLSRWCRQESGIHVRTPFGLYHLSAFFAPAAQTRETRDLTQAAEFDLVLALRAAHPDDSSSALRARLERDYQLILSERTLRRRHQYARIWHNYREWAAAHQFKSIDEEKLEQFMAETSQPLKPTDQRSLLRLIEELEDLKEGDIW